MSSAGVVNTNWVVFIPEHYVPCVHPCVQSRGLNRHREPGMSLVSYVLAGVVVQPSHDDRDRRVRGPPFRHGISISIGISILNLDALVQFDLVLFFCIFKTTFLMFTSSFCVCNVYRPPVLWGCAAGPLLIAVWFTINQHGNSVMQGLCSVLLVCFSNSRPSWFCICCYCPLFSDWSIQLHSEVF